MSDFDWSATHSLGILFLDWLLYHNNEELAECYDQMINGLLGHFDHTAKQFVPQSNTSLSYRLLCHRHKSTSDIEEKNKIEKKIKKIISDVSQDGDIDRMNIFSQNDQFSRPLLAELVSVGPSDFDSVLFNRQALKVIQCLFKSSANDHLQQTKASTKYARAAYNIIANILWSPDMIPFEAEPDSQPKEPTAFEKLLKKVQKKKNIEMNNQILVANIARMISDEETSELSDNITSQNLFQNTAIRVKEKEVGNDTTKKPKSPLKSVLRTPTSHFKKRLTQDKDSRWPVKKNLEDVYDHAKSKNVTFKSQNDSNEDKSKEIESPNSSQASDIDIISASDSSSQELRSPASNFNPMLKSRVEGSSQIPKKRKSPNKLQTPIKTGKFEPVATLSPK